MGSGNLNARHAYRFLTSVIEVIFSTKCYHDFMSTIHHVAVTVSDFERSLDFYEKLGFKLLVKKDTPEKKKMLALLNKGDLNLEMFYFDDHINEPGNRDTIGNNVKEVGQKHFAFRVDSITETRQELEATGILLASEPSVGDAGYQFFFIRDPDGIYG